MAIPVKDPLLVAWGANFDQKVNLSPERYQLSLAQALAFRAAYGPYRAAQQAVGAAAAAGAQTQMLTGTRDAAKSALLRVGRALYALVQDAIAVDPADKDDVGVVVKKTNPSRIPPPAEAPSISVVATFANTVTLRMFDAVNPSRRGRPRETAGALIFSFVGAQPPPDGAAWKFEFATQATKLDVTFPGDVPPGARVWFTARWLNPRLEAGPAAAPVAIHIPGGAAMAA